MVWFDVLDRHVKIWLFVLEVGTNPNPFDGDGLPFKGKLIGIKKNRK